MSPHSEMPKNPWLARVFEPDAPLSDIGGENQLHSPEQRGAYVCIFENEIYTILKRRIGIIDLPAESVTVNGQAISIPGIYLTENKYIIAELKESGETYGVRNAGTLSSPPVGPIYFSSKSLQVLNSIIISDAGISEGYLAQCTSKFDTYCAQYLLGDNEYSLNDCGGLNSIRVPKVVNDRYSCIFDNDNFTILAHQCPRIVLRGEDQARVGHNMFIDTSKDVYTETLLWVTDKHTGQTFPMLESAIESNTVGPVEVHPAIGAFLRKYLEDADRKRRDFLLQSGPVWE